MNNTIIGEGDYRYIAQDGWAKWPEGWDTGDVAAVGVERAGSPGAGREGAVGHSQTASAAPTSNAAAVRAPIIVEGANAPTDPDADAVLATVIDAFERVGCRAEGSLSEDDPLPAVRRLLDDCESQAVVVFSDGAIDDDGGRLPGPLATPPTSPARACNAPVRGPPTAVHRHRRR